MMLICNFNAHPLDCIYDQVKTEEMNSMLLKMYRCMYLEPSCGKKKGHYNDSVLLDLKQKK